MNGLFQGIRSDISKGNYASALFTVLIAIVLIAIPTLYFSIGNKTDKIDRIRVECAEELKQQKEEDQRRLDSIVFVKDKEFAMIRKEFSDFKDSYITKLETRREESERLVNDSKKIIKAINTETRKTKETGKVLDSVSNRLTQ